MDPQGTPTNQFPNYSNNNFPQTPQQPLAPQVPLPQTPIQPQTPPPQVPPQNSFNTQPPKKRRLGLIITLIIVALVVVGSIVAYTLGYVEMPFDFFEPEPKEVVLKMAEQLSNTKSVSFDTTVTTDISSAEPIPNTDISKATFTLNAVGSTDITDIKNPKFTSTTKISLSTESEKMGSFDANTTLAWILLNQKLYGSIKEFMIDYKPKDTDPMVAGFIGYVEGFVKSITGKWILLTSDESMYSYPELTEQDRQDLKKVRDAVLGMAYVELIEKIGTESLGDVQTRHYKIVIDLKKLQHEISTALGGIKITDDQFERDMQNLSIEGVGKGKLVFDLWIGKKDNNLYKISSPKITFTDEYSQSTVSFAYDAALKDHNKPLELSAPAESTTLEELMETIMGSMLGGSATTKSSSGSSKSDILLKTAVARLRVEAELLYDANNQQYKNVCTTGVANAASDLKGVEKSTFTSKIKCYESKDAWAASIPIGSSEWCADWHGNASEGKANRVNLKCDLTQTIRF